MEAVLVTGSIHLDCLLAAATGAAANRINHWYKSGKLTGRMGIFAILYVASGGMIGFFFGVQFGNVIIALVFGGVWPVAAEAGGAAQSVLTSVVKSVTAAGSAAEAIAAQGKAEDEDPNGGDSGVGGAQN